MLISAFCLQAAGAGGGPYSRSSGKSALLHHMNLRHLPSAVRDGAVFGKLFIFFSILGLDQEPEIAGGRFSIYVFSVRCSFLYALNT